MGNHQFSWSYMCGTIPDNTLREYDTITLEQLQSVADTGDVILMHGDHLTSQITELFGHYCWSHVAMVVKHPLDGRLYAWESMCDGKPLYDTISKKFISDGVRMVDLTSRILAYKNNPVSYRKMKWHNNTALRDNATRKLLSFARQIDARSFDRNVIAMGNSESDNLFGEPCCCCFSSCLERDDADASKSYFCSELLADTYKHMGVLPHDTRISSVSPLDFCQNSEYWDESHRLPFLYSVTFSKECLIIKKK